MILKCYIVSFANSVIQNRNPTTCLVKFSRGPSCFCFEFQGNGNGYVSFNDSDYMVGILTLLQRKTTFSNVGKYAENMRLFQ